jgi:hypothetical protein
VKHQSLDAGEIIQGYLGSLEVNPTRMESVGRPKIAILR